MPIARCIVCPPVIACLVIGLAGCTPGGGGPKLDRPYLEVRREHATVLTQKVRAPQKAARAKPPAGVDDVTYQSGDLHLQAWLAMPAGAKTEPVPAIVYFHGGFALGDADLKDCKPFLEKGYAVMLPSLRGENDNPGHFELLYGEIDDARAAVRWLAEHPRIDKGRIHTFGHSIGGGVSALLSLWDDIPVLTTGSAGGLYPYTVFAELSDILPFDRRNPLERQLRLLLGNTADMQRPHIAFLGDEDPMKAVASPAEEEAKRTGAPLTVRIVEGDHFTCLAPAMHAFVREIEKRK
jgi:dienelactone hydrolase